MSWWEYVVPFATIVASVAFSGLVAGWAAERRLDRIQARELAPPRLNDQAAEDAGKDGCHG